MTRTSTSTGHREGGYTLMSVLVALLVFSLGMIGLASMYARFVGVQAQDQMLAQAGPLSNGFWGVVQANPTIVTALDGTYTSANVAAAPAALQAWLSEVTTGPTSLPEAKVIIKTGVAAATGLACSVLNGCSVDLTIQWKQYADPNAGSSGVQRSQSFTYHF